MTRASARWPRTVEGSMAPEPSSWRMNEAMKSLRETLEDDAPPKSPSSTMRASRALRLPLRLGDEGVVGPDGSVVNVGVNP